MKPSALVAAIQTAIEAIDVSADTSGPEDVFRGVASIDQMFGSDRLFWLLPGGGVRVTDRLDPTEYMLPASVQVAYVDGPNALARATDDAELIGECLYEMVDTLHGQVLDVTVEEGVITPGPVEGTILVTRPFRVRYNRG
jgi:hypothetical protein